MPRTAKTTGKKGTKIFDPKMLIQQLSMQSNVAFMALLTIANPQDHQQAVDLMGDLMDEIGDMKNHPAHTFMNLLIQAIAHYERQIYPPVFHDLAPKDRTIALIQYLMEAQELRQVDLNDIFHSQGNVSQVLSGQRGVSLEQLHKLAKRFNVSPAFLV